MARSVYVASFEAGSGKSLVALGMMELLSRRIEHVGYFRPVIGSDERLDARIDLITQRYPVDLDPEALYAFTAHDVERLIAEGRRDEVFKDVLAAYKAVERQCDFVLCDGTDYTGVTSALEFDFNVEIANHLGAPVLALLNGHGKTTDDIVGAARVARESLASEGVTVAATIVNRVAPSDRTAVRDALAAALAEREPVWVLPEEPLLGMPTMAEIADALGAALLRGRDVDLTHEVSSYKVASMTLPNFLDHVLDGSLVIASGDRSDVIIGCLASRTASTYPNIAGLVLTGGLTPEPQVVRLLDGLADTPVPMFAVGTDTYTTAREVSAVRAVIRPGNERKVATALGIFEQHVDAEVLAERIAVARSERVTPLMFEYDLIEQARMDRRHIVLPEGLDERILRAAQLLRRRDVVDLTLLGREDEVATRMNQLGIDLDVPVIDPVRSDLREGFAARYCDLRRHKGMTEEAALDVMADLSYFGTMMVHEGLVDGMVSGAAHTTGHTLRPAFELIRTKPGVRIVSSVFFMCLPDRVLVYGDCAVNPNPDAAGLADIAISSAETASRFGIEPRVAMLSYSTGESGKGADVDTVREATAIARDRRPDLEIDGPIQYDASVDVAVARAKMPGSKVAGHATVFVFPDLNAGNNTYKAVQRSAGVVAIGPVLQGLNRPVNDLSRGCLVADVVNTAAITAIQAQDA